uniref:HYDIN/VesB/CFA65-like Ig-like domain-containing protein n=1 Tax=Chromera velia CCMP2878 TaxID=1169474 RepID=A0A0G4I9B7_9ALVE|eukprot:Cvel_12216.t1-p1 / transcript=Cvel_12216.t1 / gene=Cvel_12216 / organism=Chromera_velia_CCMP2878 / gene_product=Hydrocephalus-inducing protein homolog, putative / transcript_product=Hydrocephalus-inducing protein homolog, putative / location=Cvel_scaffold790:33199-58820(+) / protein_length=5376 / sequence_SO=supercontig / SO=protein_coding / is_pseudo=false
MKSITLTKSGTRRGGEGTAKYASRSSGDKPGAVLSQPLGRRSEKEKSPSELIADIQKNHMAFLPNETDAHGKPRILEKLDISEFSLQTTSAVPDDEPLFVPSPSIITFRDFQALQTYDAVLSLRNQDQVARRVKIILPATHKQYFEIIPGPGKRPSLSEKVAPGMSVSWTIRFNPDARFDYAVDLVVVTERADKATKFTVTTDGPFSTSVSSGHLEPSGSLLVSVFFQPSSVQNFSGTLTLQYGEGLKSVTRLSGHAYTANLVFSERSVKLEDTFIHLKSVRQLTIQNNSDACVEFHWKAFASRAEEDKQKGRLEVQLGQEKQEEALFLLSQVDLNVDSSEGGMDVGADDATTAMDEGSIEDDAPDARREEESAYSRKEKRVLDILDRKYRNIAKANSSVSITISFAPKAAFNYQCVAYCSIIGSAERVPFLMMGTGIGPKAVFSFDELEVGEVFVFSSHRYEVELSNRGAVPVNFCLKPNSSPLGSQFKFDPTEGKIDVGEKQTIVIEFNPEVLGEFNESFIWKMEGSAVDNILTFKGCCVVPSFSFDIDRLSFGIVSFGFLQSKTLCLTNTSEVPLKYALRVPGDGRFLQKEFDVTPKRGTLLPSCSQKIQVDFIPVHVRAYACSLVVDLEGVGQDLLALPIDARCGVPAVQIEPSETVHFGEIFLRYPFHQSFTIHNVSSLPAKFEIQPQDEAGKGVCEWEVDQMSGAIPPATSHSITVTLLAHRTGKMHAPLHLRILGQPSHHPLNLIATSVGPRLIVASTKLDFGRVPCIQPVQKELKVTNDSYIDAEIRILFKNKMSLWTVSPKFLRMSPHETTSIGLTLVCDEAADVSDVLFLVVKDSSDVAVTLKARGVDTPLFCLESLEVVDFERLYTTRAASKTFVIENRGKKERKLTWAHFEQRGKSAKDKEKDEAVKPKARTGRGKIDQALIDQQPERVFTVEPPTALLPPKSMCKFTFHALSFLPGEITETIQCTELVGQDRQPKSVYMTECKGIFLQPLLQMSLPQVSFLYAWQDETNPEPSQFAEIIPDEEIEADPADHLRLPILEKELVLTNISPLPVAFALKCKPPFASSLDTARLQAGESAKALIAFDPSYRVDRISATIRQKMQITYEDHPQTDTLELVGEALFPNLTVSRAAISFGAVLNETSRSLPLEITNTGKIPVDYVWYFHEAEKEKTLSEKEKETLGEKKDAKRERQSTDQNQQTQRRSEPRGSETTASMVAAPGSPPGKKDKEALKEQREKEREEAALGPLPVELNEVFDILPLRGRLEPGQTERISVSYFAFPNRKVSTTAVCSVRGGPEYEVQLSGEGSSLDYKVDKQELSFGNVAFNRSAEGEILLTNTGKLPFVFGWNLSQLSRPWLVDVTPQSGTLMGGQKQRLMIRFRPGMPMEFEESLFLECAHFEAQKIVVKGCGIFHAALLSLPRVDEFQHGALREDAKVRLWAKEKAEMEQQEDKVEEHSGSGRSSASVSQMSRGTRAMSMVGSVIDGSVADGSDLMSRRPSFHTDDSSKKMSIRSMTPREFLSSELDVEVDRHMLCDVLETQFSALMLKFAAQSAAEQVKASPRKQRGPSGGPAPLAPPPTKPPPVSAIAGETGTSCPSSSGGVPKGWRFTPAQCRQMEDVTPVVAEYVCDFGHIVLGKSVGKKILLTNKHSDPVTWVGMRKKSPSVAGFLVEPETVRKLPPGESVEISISASRAKDGEAGPATFDYFIEFEHGPSYLVKLIANHVIPDIGLSIDRLDFAHVLAGWRKTMVVRFRNELQVPAEWVWREAKGRLGKRLPPSERPFSLEPSTSVLNPGEWQDVLVHFAPLVQPPSHAPTRLPLRIKDSSKNKSIIAKGVVDALQLIIQPQTHFRLGPLLPYVSAAEDLKMLELFNPTGYAVEVVCTDLDKQLLEEDAMLAEYDEYDEYGLALAPLRRAGEPVTTWKKICRRVNQILAQRKKDIAALRKGGTPEGTAAEEKEVSESAVVNANANEVGVAAEGQEGVPPEEGEGEEEEIDEEEAALAREDEEIETEGYSFRVPPSDRLNIIILAPPLTGTTTYASMLSEDKRKVMNLDEILPWMLSEKPFLYRKLRRNPAFVDLYTKAKIIALEQEEKYKAELEEFQKNPPKVKKGEPEPQAPTLRYSFPPDMVLSLVQYRFLAPDCNAGVILDGVLTNSLMETPEEGLAVVLKALSKEKFRIFTLAVEGTEEDAETAEQIKMSIQEPSEEDPQADNAAIAALSRYYKSSLAAGQTAVEEATVEMEAANGRLAEVSKALADAEAALPCEEQEGSPTSNAGEGVDREALLVEISRLRSEKEAVEKEVSDLKAKIESIQAAAVAMTERYIIPSSEGQKKPPDITSFVDALRSAILGIARMVEKIEAMKDEEKIEAIAHTREKLAEKQKRQSQAISASAVSPKSPGKLSTSPKHFLDVPPISLGGEEDHEDPGPSISANNSPREGGGGGTSPVGNGLEGEEEGGEGGEEGEGDVGLGLDLTADAGGGPRPSTPSDLVGLLPPERLELWALSVVPPPFTVFFEELRPLVPLPAIPREPEISDPIFCQIVQRPPPRKNPAPSPNFALLTMIDKPPSKPSTPASEQGNKKGGKDAKKGGKGKDKQEEEPEEKGPEYSTQSRWVIPAGGTQKLYIKFLPKAAGVYNTTFTFECVHGVPTEPAIATVEGVCGIPTLNADPRNVFLRRVRAIRPGRYASRQWVSSQGHFDFGPLLKGRDPALRPPMPSAEGDGSGEVSAPPGSKSASPKAVTPAPGETAATDALGETALDTEPPEIPAPLRSHTETLRLTNNSLFRANVDLSMASTVHFAEETGKGGKGAKNAPADGPQPDDFPFIVEPAKVGIDPGETVEVRLWCFPSKEGAFSDQLVVSIENNPEPLLFPLKALGSAPRVSVDSESFDFGKLILGQKAVRQIKLSNAAAVPAVWSLEGASELPELFTLVPASEGTLAVGETRILSLHFDGKEETVVNETLSLKVTDVEELGLEQERISIPVNAEAFEVKVKLRMPDDAEGLDFGLVRAGTTEQVLLEASNGGKYPVKFEFSPGRRDPLLLVSAQMERSGGQLGRVAFRGVPDLQFIIYEAETGERVQPAYPPVRVSLQSVYSRILIRPARGVSFGAVETGNKRDKTLEIVNEGDFAFEWRLVDLQSLREGSVQLDARPVTPTLDTGAAAKGGKGGKAPAAKAPPPAKGNDKGKGGAAVGEPANFGPFRVSPRGGTLEPGAPPVLVEVSFSAEGDTDSEVELVLLADGVQHDPSCEHLLPLILGAIPEEPVNEEEEKEKEMTPGSPTNTQNVLAAAAGTSKSRPQTAKPKPLPWLLPACMYTLQAESCTPGLNPKWDWIFEEQFVVRNFDEAVTVAGRLDSRVFSEDEKLFSFGPVLAVPGPSGGGAPAGGGEKTEETEERSGACERFRLTNPKGIPIEVSLEVRSGGGTAAPAAGGKGGKGGAATGSEDVFEVQPQKLVIPPHEYRYCSVYFRPTALMRFSGSFSATVARGVDPEATNVNFGLTGEGALPSISFEVPPALPDVPPPDEKAPPQGPFFDFGRLAVGQRLTLDFLLKNPGILPATLRAEYSPNPHFAITIPSTLPLAPKETTTFEVSFSPISEETVELPLRLRTLRNPFEDTTLFLKGKGYVDQVSWQIDNSATQTAFERSSGDFKSREKSGLLNSTDTVNLGETVVGGSTSLSFRLQNHGDKSVRFEFPEESALPAELKGFLKLSPSVGHVHPGTSKLITATLTPTERVKVQKLQIPCTVAEISFAVDGPREDWDDTLKSVKFVPESKAEAAKAESKAKLRVFAAPADGKGAKGKAPPPDKKDAKGKGQKDSPTPEVEEPNEPNVKVELVAEEPANEVVTDSMRQVPLQVTATADFRQLSCSLPRENPEDPLKLLFAPTLLYKARSFKFKITNESSVSAPFSFYFTDLEGNLSAPPFYSITPSQGVLAPGSSPSTPGGPPAGGAASESSVEVTVRFSPVELFDFARLLKCHVPDCTAPGAPGEDGQPTRVASPVALSIGVDAQALRPVCHIDLSEHIGGSSDGSAVSAEGEPAGGASMTGIQELSFDSLGVMVRNVKRFHILNPTSQPYDFFWQQEAPPETAAAEETGAAAAPANAPQELESFRVIPKRGTVLPGKKFEVCVEYLPVSSGRHEAFFGFYIPSESSVDQKFHFKGVVKEPRVGFEKPKVNFSRLLLGGSATETVLLVNREHIPFPFQFDRTSFDFEEGTGGAGGVEKALKVLPLSGVVSPGSALPVSLTFTPNSEKSYNFNVVCHVKRKQKPVVLNVKGEGYAIQQGLSIEERETSRLRQVIEGANVMEMLDFGALQVNDKRSQKLILTNSGKFSFNFAWVAKPARGPTPPIEHAGAVPPFITISPHEGICQSNDQVPIDITFNPQEPYTLDGAILQCKVKSGKPFTLGARGRADRPLVDFSFTFHDFGAAFLRPGTAAVGVGSPPPSPRRALQRSKDGDTAPPPGVFDDDGFLLQSVELVICNRDVHSDCYVKTEGDVPPWLNIHLPPSLIPAGDRLIVPVLFRPTEPIEYRGRVCFTINEVSHVVVTFKGRGCHLRLEMASSDMLLCDFGNLLSGQAAVRQVRLVNKSIRDVDLKLVCVDSAKAVQTSDIAHSVTWSPVSTTLRPRESLPVDVRFAPLKTVAPFKTKIMAYCGTGHRLSLFAVAGKCYATDIQLSETLVLFGPVIVNSKASHAIRMHNVGDLGSRFQFEVPPAGRSGLLFSVSPSEGFLSPQEDLLVSFAFEPREASVRETSVDAFVCFENCPPMKVTLSGRGTSQPDEAVKQLDFTAAVRTEIVQTATISNPSSKEWKLTPVVKTETPSGQNYFFVTPNSKEKEATQAERAAASPVTGPILVPPGADAEVKIVYRPLTMTQPEEPASFGGDSASSPPASPDPKAKAKAAAGKAKAPAAGGTGGDGPSSKAEWMSRFGHLPKEHLGSVFIATPDGKALAFNLVGKSNEPEAEAVEATLPCKSSVTHPVQVTNWLPSRQRFAVACTILDPPPDSPDLANFHVGPPSQFEAPAGMGRKRGLPLELFAYRPGNISLQLLLTNPQSKEFIRFACTFKFEEAQAIDKIKLDTVVRAECRWPISIFNPLPQEVELTGSILPSSGATFQADVVFAPKPLKVAPMSTGKVDLCWRPLIPGNGTGQAVLASKELGSYPYEIEWNARPSGTEKTISCKAPLGNEATAIFRFSHFGTKPANLTPLVAPFSETSAAPSMNPLEADARMAGVFIVDPKPIAVPADKADGVGVQGQCEVRFVPSREGEVRALLQLRSPEGIAYKATLVGLGLPPQPQGPIQVGTGGKGGSASVEFRNPLETPAEFTFTVDNPQFVCAQSAKAVLLEAKKSVQVQLSTKADKPTTGRLIVTGKNTATWVYYLKAD